MPVADLGEQTFEGADVAMDVADDVVADNLETGNCTLSRQGVPVDGSSDATTRPCSSRKRASKV